MSDKLNENGNMFKMPKTSAKCHESKLYHTQLVRDILNEELNEGFIRRDYNRMLKRSAKGNTSYRVFKKEWLDRMRKREE